MFSWLRRWIESKRDYSIRYHAKVRETVQGTEYQIAKGKAVGIHGLKLIVQTGENDYDLIGETLTLDRVRFWELWKRFSKEEFRWESDEKLFDPTLDNR